MIPKVIHYCWFGHGEKPELARKCIESWKKFCPDFEIKEWNESNFDINQCAYVKEAYNAKKWAFVSDYVRLYALVQEGGVYLDTDVEVIKPIDELLKLIAFSGFETSHAVTSGIIAAESNLPIFKELLHEYSKIHFIKSDGEMDLAPNIIRITKTMVNHGLKMNNQKQTILDMTIFPKDYFCPKSPKTGDINLTPNTYTIHHYSGSWLHPLMKRMKKIRIYFIHHFGESTGDTIAAVICIPFRIIYSLEVRGLKGSFSHAIYRFLN